MCICMSKSFNEKINLLLFVQYEMEHVMNILCIQVLFCMCEVHFIIRIVSLYEVDCQFEFVHVLLFNCVCSMLCLDL